METAIGKNKTVDFSMQNREMMKQWALLAMEQADEALDIHRRYHLFRQSSSAKLALHKISLKLVIKECALFHAMFADPDFYDSGLTTRLHVRISQLRDAYDTLYDATLSDDDAQKVLKQVFPE